MDIIGHALAGAATGVYFGKPITGAVIAILPDAVLIGKRKFEPTEPYLFTHSWAYLVMATALIGAVLGEYLLVLFCTLSHYALDIVTHSYKWQMRFFYPMPFRFKGVEEWRFFNNSWLYGAAATIIWSASWLVLKYA